MQRRGQNLSGTAKAPACNNSASVTSPSSRYRKGHREVSGGPSLGVLVMIAGILVVINFMIPNKVEKEELGVINKLVETEEELMHRWQNKGHLPHQVDSDPMSAQRSKEEATARMKQNIPANSWVEGEKRLKHKLKVLAERQKEGKDLGVPVLTRYLGEDIPAWPDGTMDEATWKQKVDQRYKEMQAEEEEWRQRVGEFMAAYNKHR